MRKVELSEIVELFLTFSIHQIKSEGEVPNINFKFEDEAHLYFNNTIKKIFELNTTEDKLKDVDYAFSSSNDDCLNIYVKDIQKFFDYLLEYTNNYIELLNMYKIDENSKAVAMQVMRRIWLRMGISDFDNVELFLKKQSEFANNRLLDTLEQKNVSTFYDYNVYMKTIVNTPFVETTRSMIFTIKDDNDEYQLPSILYDIDDSNTCYIYGVQNKAEKKSKNIQRKLYKLNKGIENANVHPGKVYALIQFIGQLRKNNISKIVVPSMQVLSYRFHELLSDEAKKSYDDILEQAEKHPNNELLEDRVKMIKEWYDKVYNQEDKISYLKTEELLNLIYRIVEHDPNFKILNEINLQGDSLQIRI